MKVTVWPTFGEDGEKVKSAAKGAVTVSGVEAVLVWVGVEESVTIRVTVYVPGAV